MIRIKSQIMHGCVTFFPRIKHNFRNTKPQREERVLHNCSSKILFEDRRPFSIWMSLHKLSAPTILSCVCLSAAGGGFINTVPAFNLIFYSCILVDLI